jgi:hypothetical protein
VAQNSSRPFGFERGDPLSEAKTSRAASVRLWKKIWTTAEDGADEFRHDLTCNTALRILESAMAGESQGADSDELTSLTTHSRFLLVTPIQAFTVMNSGANWV